MNRGAVITLKIGGIVAGLKALASLGSPTLVSAVLVVATVVGAMCWVVADNGRANRLALLIQACRGTQQRRPRKQSVIETSQLPTKGADTGSELTSR